MKYYKTKVDNYFFAVKDIDEEYPVLFIQLYNDNLCDVSMVSKSILNQYELVECTSDDFIDAKYNAVEIILGF